MPEEKPTKTIVILSAISVEIFCWLATVFIVMALTYFSIGEVYVLPMFILGTIVHLFNFVRLGTYEFHQKKYNEAR